MKKSLLIICLAFGVFFTSWSVNAQDNNQDNSTDSASISCSDWKDNDLQELCQEALKYKSNASQWVKLTDGEKKAMKIDPETGGVVEYVCDMTMCYEKTIGGKVLFKKKKENFVRGFLILEEIKINKQKYSDLELKKMFIKARDFFEKAEKFARKPVIQSGGILPGPQSEDSGENYFMNVFLVKFINGSLVMLFSIATVIFIIGGLMFVFSSGDEELKGKAKNTIFWGAVGLAIAVLAYALIKFVVGIDFGF